jgi:hypothetical protein
VRQTGKDNSIRMEWEDEEEIKNKPYRQLENSSVLCNNEHCGTVRRNDR